LQKCLSDIYKTKMPPQKAIPGQPTDSIVTRCRSAFRRLPGTFGGCWAWLAAVLLILSQGKVFTTDALLLRGPYLQGMSPHGLVIRWRTDQPCDGQVTVTMPDGQERIFWGEIPTTEHMVHVTGLAPDTRYEYALETRSNPLVQEGDSHFFRTAPVLGSTQPVRIWVLGDSGTGTPGQFAVRDAFDRFTAEQYTHLILHVGDIAYNFGTDLEFQLRFFNVYEERLTETVFWPCIGNHDTGFSTSPPATLPYFQMFSLPTQAESGGLASGTENYYSFDYGNIHFISLDSMASDRSPKGPMAQWLTRDLAATSQDWIIAYFHHAPYSRGPHDSDWEVPMAEMRRYVVPILEAGGVDLVLSGHTHGYERSALLDSHYERSSTFKPSMNIMSGDGQIGGDGSYQKRARGPIPHRGSIYVVAGSAGTVRLSKKPYPAMHTLILTLGSLVLDVVGTRLDARFLDLTGNIADQFTLLKADLALSGPHSTPSGEAAFRLKGEPGRRYRIESSNDLKQWQFEREITLQTGSAWIQMLLQDKSSMQFFRARKVPGTPPVPKLPGAIP